MTDTALVRAVGNAEPRVHTDTPQVEGEAKTYDGLDIEPIEIRDERSDALLDALDIDGVLDEMPTEDQENHKEVKQYILDIIKKSGDSPTMGVFKRTLNEIKADMGLSENADPSTILDRIGGVVKAWKELSFISNPSEKKSVLSKLMRAVDSKDMNKIVYEEMTRRAVWR